MNKSLVVLAITALVGVSSFASAATGKDGRVIPFSEPSREAMNDTFSRESTAPQAEVNRSEAAKQHRIIPFSQRSEPPMD